MRNRRLAVVTALLVTLAAREASGDIVHLKTPSSVVTEGGSTLTLPPGYFLDEQTWQERDLEMRRLQEQETRLVAENKVLRESSDFPPWASVALGAVGIAIGITAMVLK